MGMGKMKRIAKIGRPGIGGEFLDVTNTPLTDRYKLRRFKQVNGTRQEPRQMDVHDLPASAMVYDLLGAIEAIIEDASFVDIDSHGIDGTRPSIRERFQALADGVP
jgi:hypothetical protein